MTLKMPHTIADLPEHIQQGFSSNARMCIEEDLLTTAKHDKRFSSLAIRVFGGTMIVICCLSILLWLVAIIKDLYQSLSYGPRLTGLLSLVIPGALLLVLLIWFLDRFVFNAKLADAYKRSDKHSSADANKLAIMMFRQAAFPLILWLVIWHVVAYVIFRAPWGAVAWAGYWLLLTPAWFIFLLLVCFVSLAIEAIILLFVNHIHDRLKTKPRIVTALIKLLSHLHQGTQTDALNAARAARITVVQRLAVEYEDEPPEKRDGARRLSVRIDEAIGRFLRDDDRDKFAALIAKAVEFVSIDDWSVEAWPELASENSNPSWRVRFGWLSRVIEGCIAIGRWWLLILICIILSKYAHEVSTFFGMPAKIALGIKGSCWLLIVVPLCKRGLMRAFPDFPFPSNFLSSK